MLMRRNHSTLQFNTRNIQSLAITTHHYRYILLHTCSRVTATCIHFKREREHEVCLQRQVIPKSQPNPTFYPHQPMKQWSLFKETSYPILNLIIFSNSCLIYLFFSPSLNPGNNKAAFTINNFRRRGPLLFACTMYDGL